MRTRHCAPHDSFQQKQDSLKKLCHHAKFCTEHLSIKHLCCLNMTCLFKVDVWSPTLGCRWKHRYHHRCFISVCLFSLSHRANVAFILKCDKSGILTFRWVVFSSGSQYTWRLSRCPALSSLQKMKLKYPKVTVEPLCHLQHSSAVHYVVCHLLWTNSCRNLGVSSSICPLITNVQL